MKIVFTLFLFSIYWNIFSQQTHNSNFPFPKKANQFWFIASYNIENLFDTEDGPNDDAEFLPQSPKQWNQEKYQKKLEKISEVILKMHPNNIGPDVIGLIEVENEKVVQDLMKTGKLSEGKYEVVHYESADKRGIDVALCFKTTSNIKLINSTYYRPYDDTDPNFFTRDILHVTLLMEKSDTVHFFVNHWPSRRGGEESEEKRILVADLLEKKIDSLRAINIHAKIIVMGDFNDNPSDWSITETLKAKRNKEEVREGHLWNAMADLASQGKGTHKYKNEWNMLDQFMISHSLVHNKKGIRFHEAFIFNPDFIQEKEEKYKGSPLRTFVGNKYLGGYSDHFPILLILSKK
jgi:predicted extracellular nuclease